MNRGRVDYFAPFFCRKTMADNFDTLSIQITASAQTAITQVNKLADALTRLNGALSGINASGLSNVSQAAQDMSASITSLRSSGRTVRSVAENMERIGQARGGVAQVSNATESLAHAANEAAQATQAAAQSANQGANGGFSRFTGALRNIGSTAKNAFSGLAGFSQKVVGALSKIYPTTHKAASGMRKLGSASKSASVSAKGLAKELLRVSKMLKLMITRMALRALIKEVGNGFKSLALHSEEFNASMSGIINGTKKLSYSFSAMVSPLINALAPALVYIINLLVKFLNILNQVFSALSGSGTWNKAKDFTGNWADDIEAANKQAKQLKKTVLGFDELNQLQDKHTSGGDTSNNIVDMFETVEVESKWKDLADKLKKYWDKLVDPIKKAWAKAGDYVKESWIKAFENVKKLIVDMADDFLEVWNQPRTISMLENIFKIVGNIGLIVANLADSFDRAWKKADVGKRIFEDIRNILDLIVSGIEGITRSWAEWAKEINFSPLLEGLEGWLASLEKPVKAVMGVVSDLNEHFIQPFAKWLIETGIPDLIQVFTDLNDKIQWDTIRERLDRVWNALKPFAETVWTGFVLFIRDVSDAVAGFLNSDGWDAFVDTLIKWSKNIDATDVAKGLKLIAGALIAYKGINFLSGIATGISGIGTACAGLSPLAAGAALIAGLGTAIIMLKSDIESYKTYLGKKTLWDALFDVSEETQAAKRAYAETKASNPYLNGTVSQDVKDIAEQLTRTQEEHRKKDQQHREEHQRTISEWSNKVKGLFHSLQSSIAEIVTKVWSYFSSNKWTFSGVASGLSETFSKAITKIKSIWNSFSDSLNGTYSLFGADFRINLPKIYATGGFPEDGLFMANHGELVGKFSNGKTAVANNEQITDGIARAVYSAITAANSGGGSTQYINNTIEIDGVAIARAVTQGQDRLNRRYSPTTI